MCEHVSGVVGSFWELLSDSNAVFDGFVASSELDGKGDVTRFSADHFNDLVEPVTLQNYMAILDRIAGHLGELRYIDISHRITIEGASRAGDANSPSGNALDDWNSHDWSSPFPISGFYGVEGYTTSSSISTIRAKLSMDLTVVHGTAAMYARGVAYGLDIPTNVWPFELDGLWHTLNGTTVGGIFTSEFIDDVALPLPPEDASWNWYLNGFRAIVKLDSPRTEEDSAKCACSCSGTSCSLSLNNDGVRVEIGLGDGSYGNSAGGLYLFSETPTVALSRRSALTASVDANALYDSDGVRQLATSTALVDVVTLSPQKYEVRFYYGMQQWEMGDDGFYVPEGQPGKVISVEDPDGEGKKLQVTQSIGVASSTNEFSWDTDAQQWILSRDGGNSNEHVTVAWDATHTQRADTREIRDSNNQVVSKTQEVFQTFPWGEEQISQVLDPDGLAVTTSWQFYADQAADGTNYGKLKSQSNPDGSWRRLSYDALGRIYQEITPFQNTPITAAVEQCRVTAYLYSDDSTTRTEIDTVQGQEVARRYSISGDYQRWDIICTHPGASISDATNLTTTTIYVWFGSGKWVQSIQYPNGVLETHDYEYTTDGGWIESIKSGQSTDGSTVSNGRKTVTTTNAAGKTISQSVLDIANGNAVLLSSSTTTTSDDLGRPTHIVYDDNTSEDFEYIGCCGLSSSHTDREGITTAYTYDSAGNLLSESRAGITTIYTYDPLNRLLTTTREGNTGGRILAQQNHYNLAGQMDSTTNALGQVTTFAQFLNPDGFYERDTTRPGSGLRTETYNADGSLHAIGGVAAHPMQYEYGVDPADGLFTKEIRMGDGGATTEWVKNYIDFAGRASKTLYPDNAVASISYNGSGQMSQTTDPDGIITAYGYDAKGEQTTVTLAGARTRQTVWSVAKVGDQTVQRTETWVTAANGGGLTLIETLDQTPNGRESWETRYGVTTHMQSVPNPAAATRTDTVTGPDGSSQITQYNLGRKVSVKLQGSDGGQLAYTTFGYDQFGRLQTVADAGSGTTTHSYTDLDEILSTTAPGNLTTTNHYNSGRQVDWVTLPDSSIRYTDHYPTGELKNIHGSQTYTCDYTCDAQGRIKTLTTYGAAGPATTTWNYSANRGFLVSKVYADGNGTTYPQYSLAGRLLKRVWARGVTTTYAYTNGDLTKIAYSDGTPEVDYTYDGQGRRNSVADGSGARTLDYQDDGQLSGETYTAGALAGMSTTRSYDGFLRRIGLTVHAPSKTLSQTYGYDAGSRINSISSGNFTAAYSYVANTNRLNQTTLNQTGGATLTVSRSYEATNRLASISSVSSTAGTIASYGYQLNALGQRQSATLADGSSWQYTYDAFGQVTTGNHYWSDQTAVAGQQFSYNYDSDFSNTGAPKGIGNRAGTTTSGRVAAYMANSLNQYTQRTVPGAIDVMGQAAVGATVTVNGNSVSRKDGYFYQSLTVANDSAPVYASVTVQGTASGQTTRQGGHVYVSKSTEAFNYDEDGNLIRDGRWQYTWDGENRLVEVKATAESLAAGIPDQRIVFTYDDRCRRVSRQRYTTEGGGSRLSDETHFLYDDNNLIAETSDDNRLKQSYLWGLDISGALNGAGGIGGLILETSFTGANPKTLFPISDGMGNVVALTNAVDGHLRQKYEYGPFGEVLRTATEGENSNPFGWSTMYSDRDTGLIHYVHRVYQPMTGQWLSRDRLEERGGVNLSLFLKNDPIDKVDVLGDEEFVIYVGSDHKGVSFLGAAETKKRQIERSPQFNPHCDSVHIVPVRRFRDFQEPLRLYRHIAQIYYYGHGGPGILFLDDLSTAADSNLTRDGGRFHPSWTFLWRSSFDSTSMAGLDNSHIMRDSTRWEPGIWVYGCHSMFFSSLLGWNFSGIATDLGAHFGIPGHGSVFGYDYPTDSNGDVFPTDAWDYWFQRYGDGLDGNVYPWEFGGP